MPEIYLSPASISFFNQTLLALFVTLYLIRVNFFGRGKAPYWSDFGLLIFFGGLSLFSALLFWDASVSPSARLVALYWENPLLGLALIGLVYFAYHFPAWHLQWRQEARIAQAATGVYTLFETGFASWRHSLLSKGQVVFRPEPADYALVIILGWVIIVFIRQVLRARQGPNAAYSRNFALIFGLPLLAAASNLLNSFNLISTLLNNLILLTTILLAIFLFTINYLQARAEQTSFIVRLAGGTLTAMLVLMGMLAWVVTPAAAVHYQNRLPQQQAMRYTPNRSGGYEIAAIPLQFDPLIGQNLNLTDFPGARTDAALDFAFDFFGQPVQTIYVSQDCALGMGERIDPRDVELAYGQAAGIFPLYLDYDPARAGGGLYVRQESDRLVVTCQNVYAFHQAGDRYQVQVVLYQDGAFDVAYGRLPDGILYQPNQGPDAVPWFIGIKPAGEFGGDAQANFSQPPLASGPQGLIQDEFLNGRRYMNDFMAPLLWTILVTTLFVLILVPIYLRRTLLMPLNSLINEVHSANTGGSYHPLPVINRDEIGFLTAAFNELHHDFDELVESLEERVVLRTSDLIRVNEQLQASEKRYRDLFDLESDALFIISCQDGAILEANNAAIAMYGYALDELLKMRDADLSVEGEAILSMLPFSHTQEQGITIPLRWHRKQTSERFPVEITARSIIWKGTQVYLVAIRDVTGRWIAEQELERLAVTDPLTGLYNRRHFFARSLPIFEHARHAPSELAALMIDIDHFKNINDLYGHAAGDLVLGEVAHRLTEGLRTSDVLARYGGEEFSVLLPRTSPGMAPMIAERLLKMIGDQPFVTSGAAITVTVSIGLAVLDEHVQDLDQLMVQADQAMYQAKREGRNRWVCWAGGRATTP